MPARPCRPTEPHRTEWWPRLLATVPVALVAATSVWWLGRLVPDWRVDADGREFLTLWNVDFVLTGAYACVGAQALLLVVSLISAIRFRPYTWVCVLAFLFAIALLQGAQFLLWHRPWVATGPGAIGPNGEVYRDAGDGDFGVMIVRDVEKSSRRREVEVIAYEGVADDMPYGRPLLLRTVAATDTQLVLRGPTNAYVVKADGHCLVAANLIRTFSEPPGLAHGTVARLRTIPADKISPFALIGSEDVGLESDVVAIVSLLESLERRPDSLPAALPPTERVLGNALDDPNPWIVATAKRLIVAGGPVRYPLATWNLQFPEIKRPR